MVAQIVTIVNQSGKVIKSSKTLVDVFNEAKTAYNQKKADIKAKRLHVKDTEQKSLREELARRQLGELTLIDDDDVVSRRSLDSRVKRKPVPSRSSRPRLERGFSDSFYTNDERDSPPRANDARSGLKKSTSDWNEPQLKELVRRRTDMDQMLTRSRPRRSTRSASMDDIDMDLAYGELPGPLPLVKSQDTIELREKMTTLQTLLDECNCIQHSVTATIERLSKNPDAMAAVALTLAEISNIASKLAPGALTAMKGSFPAIVAMLASPQFAIAAGVGVGITIIAFGSYKIIKKIQARKEDERMLLAYGDDDSTMGESVEELREINRIENWRRGIADVEAGSAGTSVDGEFITPVATKTLIAEGKLTEADLKSKTSSRKSKRPRKKPDEPKSSKGRIRSSVRSSKTVPDKSSGLKSLFRS